MDKCPQCSEDVQINMSNCPSCNEFIGYPNVRMAEEKDEADALRIRYKKAYDNANNRGAYDKLKEFEDGIKTSAAVINVNLNMLESLVNNDKTLYNSYGLMLQGKVRIPADDKYDRDRACAGGNFLAVLPMKLFTRLFQLMDMVFLLMALLLSV